MTSIKTALQNAQAQLKTTSDTFRLDAELLLAYTLNVSRVYLYAHTDEPLAELQENRFNTFIEQRHNGTPIAYLIGVREFWSHPFTVTPAVLIPRPETELLVELTLSMVQSENTSLLELGTGSGIIALSLAKARPKWSITATDISEPALEVAKANAAQWVDSPIQLIHSDWYQKVPKQTFDAILSNPPLSCCRRSTSLTR